MNRFPRTRKLSPVVLAASLLALGVASAAVGVQQSGFLTIPHQFVPGTPALASEVNENFQAVADAVNSNMSRIDDLVDSDVAPANVVTVAKAGGDFTSVAAALDSVSDATADEPRMVLVYPGVYDESEICRVPAFVQLRGLGRESTIVRSNRTANSSTGAAAVVILDDLGVISDLTIQNDGAAQIALGIFGGQLSRETEVRNVTVIVDGDGGVGHIAVKFDESDVTVRSSKFFAEGAATLNTGLAVTDSAGPFSQPLILDSHLEGKGVTSGMGLQMTNTAAQVRGTTIRGQFRGVFAGINGITRLQDCVVETLGLNSSLEQTGSASILSATTTFVGGNATGLANRFKYVHCVSSNYSPIVNGFGSTIQP